MSGTQIKKSDLTLRPTFQLFNLRRGLQQFEPPQYFAATPSNDVLHDLVIVDDLDDGGASDEQGADGASGLFQQSTAFDVQVWNRV